MNERTAAAETRLAAVGSMNGRTGDRTANWTQTLQNGRPTWNQIARPANEQLGEGLAQPLDGRYFQFSLLCPDNTLKLILSREKT